MSRIRQASLENNNSPLWAVSAGAQAATAVRAPTRKGGGFASHALLLERSPEKMVEGMLGKPQANELSHEYDVVKSNLLFWQSKVDIANLLSSLKATAGKLDPADRVFFLAHFSDIFYEAGGRHFSEPIDWKPLLAIAEKEARLGERILDFQAFGEKINKYNCMVCGSTSPQFLKAFLFRSVFAVSADLPEKEALISAPAGNAPLLLEKASSLIKLAPGGLETISRMCNHFLYKKECLENDIQNGNFREDNPNFYWGSFQGVSGERYTIRLTGGAFHIYPCRRQRAYAKGLGIHGPVYSVDDGEFNLYSSEQNAFFRAEMESGKITGACRSSLEPSAELAGIAKRVEALEARKNRE